MKIDPDVNDLLLRSELDGVVKGSLSDGELEKTVSFLRLVWPKGGFTWEYLHWLYRENPVGFAEVYNIWDKGKIVAHYAAIPVIAKLFGSYENGLFSLNTAVHPSYRGKGYFKLLANKTYEDAHTRGANFVIGVANANSTLLFQKQLRFQFVSPLVVKIGLGSVKRYLTHVEQLDYVRRWDKSTLLWRLNRPRAKYNSMGGGNSVSILGHTRRFGVWATMMESYSGQSIVSQKKFFRWNPITLWIGLDADCDWVNSNYVSLPDRFKPSPLNLVFKDLTGLGRTLDPNRILLSLLDLDAY